MGKFEFVALYLSDEEAQCCFCFLFDEVVALALLNRNSILVLPQMLASASLICFRSSSVSGVSMVQSSLSLSSTVIFCTKISSVRRAKRTSRGRVSFNVNDNAKLPCVL